MRTPIEILALSPIPEEAAGARFRLYQYLPRLEAEGFRVTVHPFFTNEFFRIVYQRGRSALKARLFVAQTLARLKLVVRRARYDMFLVYREAFPIGPPVIERLLSRSTGRALVYDFDDAIFLPNASDANRLIGVLKYPQKVSRIVRASTQVIVGNATLAKYARQYHDTVTIIPTCVDTTQFIPRVASQARTASARVRVGWIGSHSTVKYLGGLLPTLAAVASRQPMTLHVVGSPGPLVADGLDIEQETWTLEQEVAHFQSCDIGVYPLWDDAWGQGKSGFKAIQFMACGVPVVASPVGVTTEIIEDGVNGFLAATPQEWVGKLGWLMADPALRRRMGAAGRETVEQRYSLSVNAPRLVQVLRAALAQTGGFGLPPAASLTDEPAETAAARAGFSP